MKNKMLIFDMDGTIADLYAVDGWLEKLRAEDESPYREAEPMVDMEALTAILNILKSLGWKVVVTTWLAKNSTKEYDSKVRQTKKAWLDSFNFPYDNLHMVKYGRTKADCTRKKGGRQILIDDNKKILQGWTLGEVINAKENDILVAVIELLIEELKERGA